jgi:pyrimidine oxygenase
MSTPTICGSYESVAEELDQMAIESGIDGCLFSFTDYVEGIRSFGEHIYPRLSCIRAAA